MNDRQKAAEIFKKGGIVIFPTDTLFGIGCVIDNKKSLDKLYKMRKRPHNKPLLALASDMEMVHKYLKLSTEAQRLADDYWPGPLTIIANCYEDKVPSLVRAGEKALGIRIPDNKKMLAIIKKVGKPIVAPSANIAGEKAPKKLAEVNQDLISQADLVVEGECEIKKPSTVIDCTVEPCKIIREGAIRL